MLPASWSYLVKHQDGGGVLGGQQAGRLPLLLKPNAVLQGRFVGRGIMPPAREGRQDLADKRRLARLSGPGQHLYEPPGLLEPVQQLLVHRPLKRLCAISWQFTHHRE